jgi:hypothetical protein
MDECCAVLATNKTQEQQGVNPRYTPSLSFISAGGAK